MTEPVRDPLDRRRWLVPAPEALACKRCGYVHRAKACPACGLARQPATPRTKA